MAIQTELGGSDSIALVAPHRVFVRRGTLVKECRARDEPYEFILFNDMLLYASQTGRGALVGGKVRAMMRVCLCV
jgi:hypothetical protein